MKPEQRLFFLKVGAAAALGLFVLDHFVIEPGFARWKSQSERIATLRAEVTDGQKLLDREKNLRGRWSTMMRENLPANDSAAETVIIKAISRWEASSRVVFTNLNKDRQWKPADDGSQTLSFTISINGDQASIGRFIYEMESDTIPVSLEKFDITSHHTRGTQLTLAATFSFLRLPEAENKAL